MNNATQQTIVKGIGPITLWVLFFYGDPDLQDALIAFLFSFAK